MSDNIFSGAKKSTPQTRVSELQGTSALAESMVMYSARVPVSLSKAVKKLAIDEQTSVQALTIEALETLLKLRGKIES
jgi:hypothetical protein